MDTDFKIKNGNLNILRAFEKNEYGFFGFNSDGLSGWDAQPTIAISKDGLNFNIIKKLDSFPLRRDIQIIKINDCFVMTATLDQATILFTKDFISFHSISNDYPAPSKFNNWWAPELFQDNDGWHYIVCCTRKNDADLFNGKRYLFVIDVDLDNQVFVGNWRLLNIDCGSDIDPDIRYLNNKYYLFMSRNHLYVSNSLTDQFKRLPTNLDGNYSQWYEEGPELVRSNDDWYLYYDRIWSNNGKANQSHYVRYRAVNNDLTQWSESEDTTSQVHLRHGGFVYTAQPVVPIDYFPEIKSDSSIGTKVL